MKTMHPLYREPPYLEPTVVEVMSAAGIEDERTWAQWLGDVEVRYRAHEPGSGRGILFVLDILYQEGANRNYPVVSKDSLDQAYYVAMRMDGEPHTTADMLAHKKAPMSNTDREFLEGHCNGSQFQDSPAIGDWYAREAKAAGVDITGKVYVHSLANRPGDPEAWVSGRGDLERVVRARDWSCQGASNIRSECREEGPPPVDVAEDIIAGAIEARKEADPALAFKRPEDVYHETRDLLKPSWAA